MKYFSALMMCFTLLLPAYVSAEENISVAAAKWKEFSEPGGKGIYLTLISRIYSQSSVDFDVGSFVRAKRRFLAGEVDILVGIYRDDLAHLDSAVIPATHLDMEHPVVAIFDPERRQISSSAGLGQLVVGWYEEYNFARLVPENVVFRPIDDIGKALALLEAGRYDAIVDYEYNLDEQQRKKLRSIVLTGEKPIWLAFQNTPKGKVLMNIYDAKMDELRESGELARIFGADYARAKFGQKLSN